MASAVLKLGDIEISTENLTVVRSLFALLNAFVPDDEMRSANPPLPASFVPKPREKKR